MEPEHWHKVDALAQQAFSLPSEERAAFLAAACENDEDLRREVEALLLAEQAAGDFLELPALGEAWDSGSEPRIGPYRLLRELGRGGMSTVYLAVRDDDAFAKRTAIKVLRRDLKTDDLLRRFHNERQILANLEHPFIARLLDGGRTTTGLPYFVMEHIEGEPIDAFCDQRRLSLDERLALFLRVCSAVQYAHQNLIVHRDLKPSNILVTADGTPKLLDFGIAKLLAPQPADEGVEATQTLYRVLTPQYASPEQVRGEAITTASDVYSLGILLYRLLSGGLPYRFLRRTPAEIEHLVAHQEPPWPSSMVDLHDHDLAAARRLEPHQLRRRLSGDLDHIVMKALRKEPGSRYPSVDQLAEDLRRYLARLPVAARQGSFLYRAEKFLRRYRLGVAVAAAFLILVSGFAATTALQSRRLAGERDRAEQERQRAEQVSSFLVELFEVSDPVTARGRAVSARELLDRGATRIASELDDQPRLQAELMRTMGRVYQGLGLYEEAEKLLESALDIERSSGAEGPEVARTLELLASVLQLQGEHGKAEAFCREALRLRREVLPAEHPELARSLSQLGIIRREGGDYAEAERLLRDALALRQTLLGPEHEDIAASLLDLGETLLLQGAVAEAEADFRQALAMQRRLAGDEHPAVAKILGDLAMVLGTTHRYEEAAAALQEALAIDYQLLGSEHPQVAEQESNLAGILVELGRHEEAERLATSALTVQRKLLGEGYFGNASTLLILGRSRFLRGDLDAAEPYCRESLEVMRQQLGDRHPHIGHSLFWLARIDLAREHPATAERLLDQALTIWRAALPEGHPYIARAEGVLGACLAAQGRTEEAQELLERSYRILAATGGEEHELTRWVLGELDKLRRH